jgi:hypothetical protein
MDNNLGKNKCQSKHPSHTAAKFFRAGKIVNDHDDQRISFRKGSIVRDLVAISVERRQNCD